MWELIRFLVLAVALHYAVCETDLEDNFMDCEENDKIFGLLRRCCVDDQLPKGCECFDISRKTDFKNSMFHKPTCPENLDVSFFYYDRDHATTPLKIRAGAEHISNTPFNGERKTVMITHGFTDSAPSPWVVEMKDELLEAEDLNVIMVNWQRGARPPNYYQAVANTRTVGAMVGRLVEDLNIHASAQFENFHLVGHSLGAHIMGYAGKEIYRLTGKMIGRITGLDPAGPAYESHTHYVRIDASDAIFVEIIHTDAETLLSSGFGTRYSIGHVDFYPNGGRHQPGCPKETFGILSMYNFQEERLTGACSHCRALDFFTNSISKCLYAVTGADGKVCNMGYHTDVSCRGEFRFETQSDPPYC